MFEGERVAHKAKCDLRELSNIEPALGQCKPVTFDELPSFLASLECYGVQGSQSKYGNLERQRVRKLRGFPDTCDDERETSETCDTVYRRRLADGFRHTA